MNDKDNAGKKREEPIMHTKTTRTLIHFAERQSSLYGTPFPLYIRIFWLLFLIATLAGVLMENTFCSIAAVCIFSFLIWRFVRFLSLFQTFEQHSDHETSIDK